MRNVRVCRQDVEWIDGLQDWLNKKKKNSQWMGSKKKMSNGLVIRDDKWIDAKKACRTDIQTTRMDVE